MKTALLQCNPVTGDIAGNIERISQAVRRAGKVDLCVTPELALSGVAPGDFLSMNDFVEGCRKGLDILAARFVSGPDLLVGAPVVSVYEPSLLSNAAVYIHRGQWDVISRKVRPEASRDPDAEFFDRGVSLGIVNLAGWRLGIVLCEEDSNSSFWTVRGTGYMPLLDLISRGVDAIIHMRATPYVIGKRADHEAMLTHVAARHHIHLLSVNIVGGNDGLVFAGQSLALDPTGTVYARGQAFAEDTLILDMATVTTPVATVGRSWQENVFGALVLGTRDFIHKCGREKALVSISGGIDSGLVLAIAVEALGAHNVSAVIMPSPETSPDAVAGALQLAHTLGVKVSVIRIDGLMAEYERAVAQTMKDFSLGVPDASRPQLQERIRGSIMTTLANRAEGLVLSTINKSEAAMGYCTLYGDTVGSLGVIADLTKSQVYAVAHWLNQDRKGLFPETMLKKSPSCKSSRQMQDLPYGELDEVLDALLAARPRRPLTDLHPRQSDVRQRVFGMEFKRRQEPQPLYVSDKPFGRSWTVPLVGHFNLP